MSSIANGACMNLCVAAWRLEAAVITLPAQEKTLRKKNYEPSKHYIAPYYFVRMWSQEHNTWSCHSPWVQDTTMIYNLRTLDLCMNDCHQIIRPTPWAVYNNGTANLEYTPSPPHQPACTPPLSACQTCNHDTMAIMSRFSHSGTRNTETAT